MKEQLGSILYHPVVETIIVSFVGACTIMIFPVIIILMIQLARGESHV